ncbi:MAG: hypothetical protein ABI175_23975 [Polyangiales bacterium]
MPQDARSLASPAPGPGAPRHISARDVRDLALAVIEGAVAAEALAKELKRSPDRSRHFQDIAERLRAVVARTSIRSALAEEAASGNVVVTPSMTQVTPAVPTSPPVPPPMSMMSAVSAPPVGPPALPRNNSLEAPTPPVAQAVVADEVRTSGERVVPPLTTEELVMLVTRALRGDEISTRLARLEHAVGASAQQASDAARQAVVEASARTLEVVSAGEMMAVSTPAEALALAARLTERVQAGVAVTVRIETNASGIRRG